MLMSSSWLAVKATASLSDLELVKRSANAQRGRSVAWSLLMGTLGLGGRSLLTETARERSRVARALEPSMRDDVGNVRQSVRGTRGSCGGVEGHQLAPPTISSSGG